MRPLLHLKIREATVPVTRWYRYSATNEMKIKDILFHPDCRPMRIALTAVAALAALQVALSTGDHWGLGLIAVLSVVTVFVQFECYLHLTHTPFDSGLLQKLFLLSRDRELFPLFETIAGTLLRTSHQSDPIFRKTAIEQFNGFARQFDVIAGGTIEFPGTETWRIVYEQLLRSPGLHSYRSVSWVRNEDYWQDGPGRQTLRLNAELQADQRISIQRIVILADSLWPTDRELPSERIRQWLHEQHTEGIWIGLIRESMLKKERVLLQDMGIYGSRAVGFQEFDEASQPTRFVIKFDFNEVTNAEDRWKRLRVYSTSYQDFLDQLPLGE